MATITIKKKMTVKAPIPGSDDGSGSAPGAPTTASPSVPVAGQMASVSVQGAPQVKSGGPLQTFTVICAVFAFLCFAALIILQVLEFNYYKEPPSVWPYVPQPGMPGYAVSAPTTTTTPAPTEAPAATPATPTPAPEVGTPPAAN